MRTIHGNYRHHIIMSTVVTDAASGASAPIKNVRIGRRAVAEDVIAVVGYQVSVWCVQQSLLVTCGWGIRHVQPILM